MQPSTRRGRELGLPLLFHRDRWRRAARVTSDAAPAVGTEITANIATAAVIVAATTPEREGLAAAILLPPPLIVARCRVGLHASRMGVGAMLKPVIPRPPTKGAGKTHSREKLNGKRLERNKREHTGW